MRTTISMKIQSTDGLAQITKCKKSKTGFLSFVSFPPVLPNFFSQISYFQDTRTIGPGSSGITFQNFATREEN